MKIGFIHIKGETPKNISTNIEHHIYKYIKNTDLINHRYINYACIKNVYHIQYQLRPLLSDTESLDIFDVRRDPCEGQ